MYVWGHRFSNEPINAAINTPEVFLQRQRRDEFFLLLFLLLATILTLLILFRYLPRVVGMYACMYV